MTRPTLLFGLLGLLLSSAVVQADSIWERRDPNHAYLFRDQRARRVGDLLTVVIRESTLFNGKEKSKMQKKRLRAI